MKKSFLGVSFFFLFSFLSLSDASRNSLSANAIYDLTDKTSNEDVFQWAKTYGGANAEWLKGNFSLALTRDGGYIVAGINLSFDPNGDFWVFKLDSSGHIEWQRTYGSNQEDTPYAGIHETEDGGYIVAGLTMASVYGTHVFWVLKLTSNGDIEWQRTYGDENEADYPYCFQLTNDGIPQFPVGLAIRLPEDM